MSKNIHILVLKPNRALVLVDDEVRLFEFSRATILEWLAHLHGNPPIMIDVTDGWGPQLIRDLQALGYSNFSKMRPVDRDVAWHD